MWLTCRPWNLRRGYPPHGNRSEDGSPRRRDRTGVKGAGGSGRYRRPHLRWTDSYSPRQRLNNVDGPSKAYIPEPLHPLVASIPPGTRPSHRRGYEGRDTSTGKRLCIGTLGQDRVEYKPELDDDDPLLPHRSPDTGRLGNL